MRKSLVLAAALVASLFAFSGTASAQSIGVTIGGHGGGVGIYIGDGHRHGGYRNHGNYRRGGCGGCDNDGYSGGYRAPVREVITVYVTQFVNQRVYDPSCGRYVYVQRRVQVPVRAYWDYNYGGYFYTDQYGRTVRVSQY